MTQSWKDPEAIGEWLETVAASVSFDGTWNAHSSQYVSSERRVSLPGADNAELFVSFRANSEPSGDLDGFLGRYAFMAGVVYHTIDPQFIPQPVQRKLQEDRLRRWDPENGDVHLITDSDSTESRAAEYVQLLRDDCLDISDVAVRFERTRGYVFSNGGQDVAEHFSEGYYHQEDDKEIVYAQGSIVHGPDSGNLLRRQLEYENDRERSLSLDSRYHSTDELSEYKRVRRHLKGFLKFNALVDSVEQDQKLERLERQACYQKSLAMVAFLQYQTSAGEIYAMLYD